MASSRRWTNTSKQYKEIRSLGKGGNGVVYEVAANDGSRYALKQLFNTKNKKAYQRFRDEITVLNQLQGQPGVVQISDHYLPKEISHAKQPYYVMPLGTPIMEFFAGKGDEFIFKQFIQLSETLTDLHDADITHRDIKPANMLVFNSIPSFSDFGLANFPSKSNISSPEEPIGAKWTIAPEMQRISSTAEFKKADVYSMAKTLWMMITKQSKGFEGQYVPQSNIGLRKFVDLKINTSTIAGEWNYHSLVLLDKLLADSTSNDPEERPTMEQFTERLKYWLHSNDEYFERNTYEWEDALDRIFPIAVPLHSEWSDLESIFRVLGILTQYDSLNHMFYPTRGGMDMDTVEFAQEEGCLILLEDVIVKPQRLIFDLIGQRHWSYFRLECSPLDRITESSGIREEVYLDVNGEYVNEDEPHVRRVSRFLSGSFIITFKTSAINLLEGSFNGYSAFHNALSAEQYRHKLEEIKSTN